MQVKSGIYFIQNIENGKIYIGSAVHITERWRLHKVHLRNGNHHNKHLQAAWVKHGEDSFRFGVIEYIEDKDMLLEREQYWIDQNGVYDRGKGYNAAPVAGSMLGFKHTEESKERLRKVGFPRGHSPWNKGKKMEGEYLKNFLESMKSEVMKKTRRKKSDGFKHTDATKKKISEKGRGRPCSEETRKKHAKAMTGKKLIMPIGWKENQIKAWEKRKLEGKVGWDTRRLRKLKKEKEE
jgi:group I intron endonuclease